MREPRWCFRLSVWLLALPACVQRARPPVWSGAAPGAPPAPSTPPPQPPPTKSGTVTLLQNLDSAGHAQYLVVAGFAGASSRYPSSRCTQLVQDDCKLSDCSYDTRQTPQGLAPQVSAGAIEVHGARIPLTLMPDAGGRYRQEAGPGPLWVEGGALTVSASGADVPPFVLSLPRMGLVRMTNPTGSGVASAAVDRLVPLSVTWTGSSVGQVAVTVLSFEQGPRDHHTVSIHCVYSAARGGATVPAALVARLIAGSVGTISLSGRVTTEVRAGEWLVIGTALSGDTTVQATYR